MIRKDYVFDASAQTITFTDAISIEQIGIITNITDGVQIYNPMDATKLGTVSGNILTLAYNTTSMSDTDFLQIFYGNSSAILSVEIDDMFITLRNLLLEIANPAVVDNTLNRMRATSLIESGTITTVTTVTTVAALTNIDSYQGRLAMIGIDEMAMYDLVRTRIS
jgi:hypothetical protein